MSQGTDPPVVGPSLSLSAWDELRDDTAEPASCDPSDAALVAAAVLADVRDFRYDLGEALIRSAAGSASRRLANTLNSVERLALAAQRLGVEALTARLRYDLAGMETRCADMYWHLYEAAGLLTTVDEQRADVAREATGRDSPVEVAEVVESDLAADVVIDVRDVSPPADDASTEDAVTESGDRQALDAMRGRIVAAAMGIEPDAERAEPEPPIEPATVDPASPVIADAVEELIDKPAWPAWEPSARSEWSSAPSPGAATPPRGLRRRVEQRRVRLAEVRSERALIRQDERRRGSRPRIPTWLAQGFVTVLICVLLALVVLGVWLLFGSDVGPF